MKTKKDKILSIFNLYNASIVIYKDIEIIIHENKTKYWSKNGKYHNETGPAIIYADGTKRWYKNGELHNENGPAIIQLDSKRWYLNGNPYIEKHWRMELEKQKRNHLK